MKRQDIVNKLLSEGFSKETLVNFSDKQLEKLSKMIVSETLNIPKDDKQAINKAKQEKKMFDTYEGDMNEEGVDGCLDKNPKKRKEWFKTDREDKLKGLDKNKNQKGKMPIKNVENQKKARKQQKGVKTGSIQKDIDENSKFMKKQHINKGFKGVGKKVRKNSIVEWVNEIANKKYTSITTKNEIMEMVTTKLEKSEKRGVKKGHNGIPEFMSYDEIKNAGVAEPTTKPKEPVTKPGTRPRPKTPYQPGPGTNPRPKAMGNKSIK